MDVGLYYAVDVKEPLLEKHQIRELKRKQREFKKKCFSTILDLQIWILFRTFQSCFVNAKKYHFSEALSEAKINLKNLKQFHKNYQKKSFSLKISEGMDIDLMPAKFSIEALKNIFFYAHMPVMYDYLEKGNQR